ncbi:MAG: prepilin-type N-terminal cleavage/methylation domain-containing protein [Acidobacteria bacterium]|nr:prepilin-type N-terminal cleavage/methylation domain-containing protein [Acidobacteriota bacterium]MCI0620721.1 prepilin-type N-terminal cleavage/methylation domain-containing protein [Acidobacteriota bacterium]MCI0722675.1 prepilin-type N-terminal cleavage/methylation domain-containing protein [Acidobacteriota bacterium]
MKTLGSKKTPISHGGHCQRRPGIGCAPLPDSDGQEISLQCIRTASKDSPTARSSEQGFSLIELLVTTLVMTIVMGSLLALSNQSQARSEFEQDLVALNQSGREVADQIYRDIRLAGFPQQKLFAASLNWTAATSNKVASGFTTINANGLTFQGDIDNDGVVEVVEYNLSGTTLRRSEVEKNNDGTVPSADYQIFAENVTGLTFTYNRLNSGVWATAGVTAANTARVDAALTLQTPRQDPQSKQYRNTTFQTSVVARNLE